MIESHVLPEWGYAWMYDHKHRTMELAPAARGLVRLHQKGLREPLLCAECDNGVIGKYDGYGKALLSDTLTVPPPGASGHASVDYDLLKLFQLSLLWRSHLARGPLFSQVDLGAKHAERIREMLLKGAPGEAHQYPCPMIAVHLLDDLARGFIPAWFKARPEGHRVYVLPLFAGFQWLYVVSGHRHRAFEELALRADGMLPTFCERFQDMVELRQMARALRPLGDKVDRALGRKQDRR